MSNFFGGNNFTRPANCCLRSILIVLAVLTTRLFAANGPGAGPDAKPVENSGNPPEYELTGPDIAMPRFLARQLTSKNELESTSLSDHWGEATLSDRTLSVNYPGTSSSFRKGAPQLGYLYRAKIRADFSPDRDRVLLKLPLSAFVTTILIDGKPAAHFTEGYLPLEADLTGYLTPGKESELLIRTVGYQNGVLDQNGKRLYAPGAEWRYTGGLAGIPHLVKVPAIRPVELAAGPARGRLKLQGAIVNQSRGDFSGTAKFVVADPAGKELFVHEQPVRIAGGKRIAVECTFSVGDELKLWDIGQPNLYFAELKLLRDGSEQAAEKVRFGYRYIEIRGDDFYLNGRHVRLRGPWGHRSNWLMPRLSVSTGKQDKSGVPAATYRKLLEAGMNAARLHNQPFPERFYSDADEAGYLLIAESAIGHRGLPEQAATDHLTNFVKALRNHPSIVVWSATNEFSIWVTPRPQKVMNFLEKLREVIRRNDPSLRPVQHSGFGDANGKLDIYSVHYPAELEGCPRQLYWTRDPGNMTRKLYHQNFNQFNPIGKKPLFYGEELMPHIVLDLHSMFTGENGLRAYYRAKSDPAQSADAQLDVGLVWRYHIRAEREQNVGLISPIVFYLGVDSVFMDCLKQEFRPAGAYPIFPMPILTAGEKNLRRFAVFEDDGYPVQGRVAVSLEEKDGRSDPLAVFDVKLDGGTVHEKELTLIPPLSAVGRRELVTRFSGNDGKVIYTDRTTVRVIPPPRTEMLDMTVQVWGRNADFAGFAEKHGIRLVPADPANLKSGVLAILPNVPESELAARAGNLSGFISNGGRLLIFERRWEKSPLPGDVRFTPADARSCLGFVRRAGHPALAGLDDLDFAYWNPDLTIAGQSAVKSESGNVATLVDGDTGLEHSFLWEFRLGGGVGVVNHLSLLSNLKRLPQADRLLANLLLYLKEGVLPPLETPVILAGKQNDFAALEFTDLGAVSDGSSGPLIVTRQAIAERSVPEIAAIAEKFRNVVFLNAPRDAAAELGRLLTGFAPHTGNAEKINGGKPPENFLYYTCDLPVYAGLTSGDLNWDSSYRPEYGFLSGDGWQGGISGGCDAVGKNKNGGTVIFLNLPYDHDVPNADRKTAFSAQLLGNLGGRLAMRRVGNRVADAESRFKTVDLASVANASRSRIFSGFPEGRVELNGVPFRIASESTAKPNGMLRLNGHARLPRNIPIVFDTPLDEFREDPKLVRISLPVAQVESLQFLLTATHNWKLDKYRKGTTVATCRLCYRDGTSAELPLKPGRNVNAGRDIADKELTHGKTVLELPVKINTAGEKAKIYMTEWSNPHPEKKIDCLEIRSAYNPPYDLMVFGITAETTDKAYQ